ncbi:metal-dependent hydrolase [Salipaludibacillus agaradhaerens]|uniref:Metal-dependent hydrolase n=1 Tax=Salipaludibacillus agaradhaerens TaxID=76935 RepID=A0A9Q4B4I5_SALAG|nr:metal-dependent hydrolase [Salipaludibacillus agaradhaerens]MCR6097872.1 metal-dependent hydrolase [Salipaludibacillus agaradhaerens]MCR6116499.1 metal-dependent hydrolase [Salipaludibacillus agaradhaerens]
MRYYTHITTSLSTIILVGDVLPVTIPLDSAIALSGLVIGSVLPDIDESRSWIGRRIPVISTVINGVFGHRGLTHSGLILLLLVAGLFHFPHAFLQAMFTGAILHIVADFFSVGGVPLFYPFSKKRSQVGLYKTGTWSEGLLFLIGLAVIFSALLM